jgi:RNA polymerase sigma factor (TIGR02999 family)
MRKRIQTNMQSLEITRLLNDSSTGNKQSYKHLIPYIYDELQRMARKYLQGEHPGHTLNTTALVHEAYLKLVKFDRINYQNRQHFFAIASQIMRNILVDYAVKQKAQKRGGKQNPVILGENDVSTEMEVVNVLSIHQALEHLAAVDERQMHVIECRFFGGLSVKETAKALNISEPTVNRDWNMARAWLNRELADVKNET